MTPEREEAEKRSKLKVRRLLGMEVAPEEMDVQGTGEYGLGTARTLQQFQDMAGVNFREQRMAERAACGALESTQFADAAVNAVLPLLQKKYGTKSSLLRPSRLPYGAKICPRGFDRGNKKSIFFFFFPLRVRGVRYLLFASWRRISRSTLTLYQSSTRKPRSPKSRREQTFFDLPVRCLLHQKKQYLWNRC
jgi:hypothetical protein